MKEKEKSLTKIAKRSYIDKKESILMIEGLLQEHATLDEEGQEKLIRKALEETSTNGRSWSQVVKTGAAVLNYVPNAIFGASQSEQTFTVDHRRRAKIKASETDDPSFLEHLKTVADNHPSLLELITETITLATDYLKETLEKLIKDLVAAVENTQSQTYRSQLQAQIDIERRNQVGDSRRKFLADVKDAYCNGSDG